MTDLCSRCRARLQDLLDDGPDAPDVAELRAHLAHCPACTRDLAMLRAARAELQTLPALPAPPDLRLRVRAQIEDEARNRRVKAANRFAWLQRPAALAWSGGLTLAAICLLWLARPVQYSATDSALEPGNTLETAPTVVKNQDASSKTLRQTARPKSQIAPRGTTQLGTHPRSNAAPHTEAPPIAVPHLAVPHSPERAVVPHPRVEPKAPVGEAPAASSRAPKLAPPASIAPPSTLKPSGNAAARGSTSPSLARRDSGAARSLSVLLVPLEATGAGHTTSAQSPNFKGRDERDGAFAAPSVQNAPSMSGAQADTGAQPKGASSGETNRVMSGAAPRIEAVPNTPQGANPAQEQAPASDGAVSSDAVAKGRTSTIAPPRDASPDASPSARLAPPVPMVRSTAPDAGSDREARAAARTNAATGSIVRARLEVVPDNDIARAALRLDFPSGLRLESKPGARIVVWRGHARKGQKIVVLLSLRLQGTTGAAFNVSLRDEARQKEVQSRRVEVGTKAGDGKSKPQTRR